MANQALVGFEWTDQKLRMIGKILLCLLWCREACLQANVLSGMINGFFTIGSIEAAFDDFMESALVQWFLPSIAYQISPFRHGYLIDALQVVLPLYWQTVLEAPEHRLHAEFTT